MNLGSLFPGVGAAPVTGTTSGFGFNWIIWVIIILVIIWFGRSSFGTCGFPNLGYSGCGYPGYPGYSGYPGFPGTGPFGGSWLWFIVIILILVWLLGSANRF
jgi:hypothetical protein